MSPICYLKKPNRFYYFWKWVPGKPVAVLQISSIKTFPSRDHWHESRTVQIEFLKLSCHDRITLFMWTNCCCRLLPDPWVSNDRQHRSRGVFPVVDTDMVDVSHRQNMFCMVVSSDIALAIQQTEGRNYLIHTIKSL